MNKRRSCLYIFLGVVFICLVLAALAWKPYHMKTSDVNACTMDSECIIVHTVGCGNPVAINRGNAESWELHRKLRKYPYIIPVPIMCAPSIPPEYFHAECLQNACQAVLIEEHAILEFTQSPRLGEPTELVFRFKKISGFDNGRVKITFIPDLVTVNSGDLTWEGSLSPGAEQEMRVSVTFSKPGYYQVQGETFSSEGRQQTDVYLLLTEGGLQYGVHPENEWDTGHQAFPVGEEDSRLFREFLFDPIPAVDEETRVVYRIRPGIDLESADMQIVLPPGGFELLDVTYPAGGEHGEFTQDKRPLQLWWRGPVRAGETLEIRATVRVTAQGWGIAYDELRAAELPGNVIYAFVYADEYNGFYEFREEP